MSEKAPKKPYRDLINEIGQQRDGKAWIFLMTITLVLSLCGLLGIVGAVAVEILEAGCP